jgi:hypothetical protein
MERTDPAPKKKKSATVVAKTSAIPTLRFRRARIPEITTSVPSGSLASRPTGATKRYPRLGMVSMKVGSRESS